MSDAYTIESRRAWRAAGDAQPSTEQLQLGCLQRMAASLETIAEDKASLEASLNYWKRYAERLAGDVKTLQRQNAGLRGVITRMKRKAAQ